MSHHTTGSREIVLSSDGSHTLFSSRFGEHYHSSFGAIQESKHIFIEAGLRPVTFQHRVLNIFEVGFGTGLNALLTLHYAQANALKINYVAVEAFSLGREVIEGLNYPELVGIEQRLFSAMHASPGQPTEITSSFNITVLPERLQDVRLEPDNFNVVYFDAFSPDTQPEMWSVSCFEKIYTATKRGGILTTYSCKGSVKRALKSAGFAIEKLPGPPGKREFLRAIKS